MLIILCLVLVASSACFVLLMLSLNRKMEELIEEVEKLIEANKKIQKGSLELEKSKKIQKGFLELEKRLKKK